MRILAVFTLSAVATLFAGCSDWLAGPSTGFVHADVPAFADPSRHAQSVPVPDEPPPLSAQTALLAHARAARLHGTAEPPERVRGPAAEGAPSEPPPIQRPTVVPIDDPEPPDPETLPTRDGRDDEALPEPAATPEAEATAWLEQASALTPGCILNDSVPTIALPSPEALAWLVTTQPRGFSGVAREALVCLLGLPRATKADVYGVSAFLPSAAALRASIAGDERPLGVLVVAVSTNEPAGQGALVVALDERDDGWTLRDALYLPWEGSEATYKLGTLTEARVLSKKRSTLTVRQRDRYRSSEQLVALTTLDAFVELARFDVQRDDDRGDLRGSVDLSGKAFPRSIDYRVLETSGGVKTWRIERWSTSSESPYERASQDAGDWTLDGAAELLIAGRTSDAAWLYEALDKEQRATAAALALGARIDAKRKRHRRALSLWKKAVAAPDAEPNLWRDYGRYLATQKKKKDAVKALGTYLERAPYASDVDEVVEELVKLGGKRPAGLGAQDDLPAAAPTF